MSEPTLIYPVIFQENNDEDGHYFTVTSPNLPGMVTEGTTRSEAAVAAIDAIATMLDGEVYPEVQDSSAWQLEPNESIVYVPVDMARWYHEKARLRHANPVRCTITVPQYLNDLAKERGLNLSRIATAALEQALQDA